MADLALHITPDAVRVGNGRAWIGFGRDGSVTLYGVVSSGKREPRQPPSKPLPPTTYERRETDWDENTLASRRDS